MYPICIFSIVCIYLVKHFLAHVCESFHKNKIYLLMFAENTFTTYTEAFNI